MAPWKKACIEKESIMALLPLDSVMFSPAKLSAFACKTVQNLIHMFEQFTHSKQTKDITQKAGGGKANRTRTIQWEHWDLWRVGKAILSELLMARSVIYPLVAVPFLFLLINTACLLNFYYIDYLTEIWDSYDTTSRAVMTILYNCRKHFTVLSTLSENTKFSNSFRKWLQLIEHYHVEFQHYQMQFGPQFYPND